MGQYDVMVVWAGVDARQWFLRQVLNLLALLVQKYKY
jgi:hypothetical protein